MSLKFICCKTARYTQYDDEQQQQWWEQIFDGRHKKYHSIHPIWMKAHYLLFPMVYDEQHTHMLVLVFILVIPVLILILMEQEEEEQEQAQEP